MNYLIILILTALSCSCIGGEKGGTPKRMDLYAPYIEVIRSYGNFRQFFEVNSGEGMAEEFAIAHREFSATQAAPALCGIEFYYSDKHGFYFRVDGGDDGKGYTFLDDGAFMYTDLPDSFEGVRPPGCPNPDPSP